MKIGDKVRYVANLRNPTYGRVIAIFSSPNLSNRQRYVYVVAWDDGYIDTVDGNEYFETDLEKV